MFLEGMIESSQWCLAEIVPYKSFMQQTIISWFDFPFPDHIFFSNMGGEVGRTEETRKLWQILSWLFQILWFFSARVSLNWVQTLSLKNKMYLAIVLEFDFI